MNINRIPALLVALVMAGPFSSCQTATPASSALRSGHWHQVRKKPPTYFPTGVPADHPTRVEDGYWINSGDRQGTRFFIPAHGTEIPPEVLFAEAQEAMSPEAKAELKRAGLESNVHDVQAGTARTVVTIGGVILGAAGQVLMGMGR